MTHEPTIATTYTEFADEPNGCSITVPSGRGIYIMGSISAVDIEDVKFGMSWNDMQRNAPETVDDPELEVGSILLSDGLHRVFLTWTHRIYVDDRIY